MHKCMCGTEFEGKFCPNCGTKWEEEKVCPSCGAKLMGGVRYCNECGYSFGNNQNEQKRTQDQPKSNLFKILYGISTHVPAVLYVIFAVLIFAFYSASLAIMPGGSLMGEEIPAESYGNVFTLFKEINESELLIDVPELKNGLSALIVIAILSSIYALVVILFKLFKFGKKEIKIKDIDFSISQIISSLSIMFYVIFLIAGISINSSILKADEGMGVIVAGSCPKLLIAFSIVFAIISVGSLVVNVLISIKFPRLVQEIKLENKNKKEINKQKKKQAKIDAENERQNAILEKRQAFILAHKEYYDTHTEPQYSDNMTKKEKYIYKRKKKMYDNAIDGEPSKASIFFGYHKKFTIFLMIFSVFLCFTGILTGVYFSSNFRTGVVSKIQLGLSSGEVLEILGKPDFVDSGSNFYNWYYYSENFSSEEETPHGIKNQIEDLEKYIETNQPAADEFFSIRDRIDKLENKLKSIKTKLIVINYRVEEYSDCTHEKMQHNWAGNPEGILETEYVAGVALYKDYIDAIYNYGHVDHYLNYVRTIQTNEYEYCETAIHKFEYLINVIFANPSVIYYKNILTIF